MTLLDMIKKYEGVKQDLLRPRMPGDIKDMDSIGVVDIILEDLKGVEGQQPSWVTVRDKIMKKIDRALESDDPDGALKLAQTLSIIPA